MSGDEAPTVRVLYLFHFKYCAGGCSLKPCHSQRNSCNHSSITTRILFFVVPSDRLFLGSRKIAIRDTLRHRSAIFFYRRYRRTQSDWSPLAELPRPNHIFSCARSTSSSGSPHGRRDARLPDNIPQPQKSIEQWHGPYER